MRIHWDSHDLITNQYSPTFLMYSTNAILILLYLIRYSNRIAFSNYIILLIFSYCYGAVKYPIVHFFSGRGSLAQNLFLIRFFSVYVFLFTLSHYLNSFLSYTCLISHIAILSSLHSRFLGVINLACFFP